MTVTTKAVILARGLGSRMRRGDTAATLSDAQSAAADSGVKGMIPIDRPFLDYVISALADAGLSEVCLVIGPEHDAVRAYYTQDVRPERVHIHFAIQEHPRGTADAVAAAAAFAGDDPVLVLNADNYYPVSAYRAIASLGGSGLVGFDAASLVVNSNIPAERIRAFALVTADSAGHLASIVEKPDEATWARLAGSARVSMNLWSFTPVIFEACPRVQLSPRGELELQDAVRIARDEFGEAFTVVPSSGGVLDLSSRQDIPRVAAALEGVKVVL
ncbi:MAG: NTP transferase domain-containing protein [Gemmatimonadaceae bacterium]|nr:NTP transferase domain-containing protein [Gemmatimonadaceae bacterium]